MIAKGKIFFLSALLISSNAFASDSDPSNKLVEAIEKEIALGYYKITEIVTDKENQEAVKRVVKKGYKKSKAAYEQITGRDDNKKLKGVLIDMGFAKQEDQTIVLDVRANYRYLPQLANVLAEAKVEVYEVSFDQLINNNEETRREFRKCTLIAENKDDKVNYTLSSCSITTKNYVGAPVSSDEMLISQDREEGLLVTHQIRDIKLSENR